MRTGEILTIETCPKRYEFDQLGLVTPKGKSYHLAIAAKKTVKELMAMTEADARAYIAGGMVKSSLETLVGEKELLQLSRDLELTKLSENIGRYVLYLLDNSAIVLNHGVTQDVKIDGRTDLFTVSCDMIIEINGVVDVVKLKTSAPRLTYGGRKEDTSVDRCTELYLLQVLGQTLFPCRIVKGSYHHMAGSQDKKAEGLPFELKKGNNIVSVRLMADFEKHVVEKISALVDSTSFDMTCDKTKCETCGYKKVCSYKKPQEIKYEEIKVADKASSSFVLTPTQRKAVIFDEGVLRINAGAGSGKTTVLALRVEELILNGTQPEDILLITFTNKGAGEMREKIQYWLKKEGIEIDSKRFNIATFNSWGGKIIEEKFADLGFTAPPKIIEKVQKYDIIFNLLENYKRLEGFDYKNPLMSFRHAKGVVVAMEGIFDYIKVRGISTVKQLDGQAKGQEAEALELYKLFNEELKRKNLIEYQDQINLLNVVVDTTPELLDGYNYEHIIVDEFQDSDAGQMDLILFLSNQPKFKSLMIVGDDSQSIFGFRNTSTENILNFHQYFGEIKDIQMVDNFRSTSEILALANALNHNNVKKVEKTLKSGMGHGLQPLLMEVSIKSKEDQEYVTVAENIRYRLSSGYRKPEDIAVISRTKGELFKMQKCLNELGIPSVIAVPEPFLLNPHIHIAQSLLEFLEDLVTTQGLFEYLYVKTNGYEGMTREEIKKFVTDEASVLEDSIMLSAVEDLDAVKHQKFYSMMEEFEDEDVQDFLKKIKDKNFVELKTYIDKFISYEDGKTVEKKADNLRAVTLITAHTSKGKEYKVVYNMLSKFKKEGTDDEMDEERRTLFVSVTRAKEELLIVHRMQAKADGFLHEIRDMKGIRIVKIH